MSMLAQIRRDGGVDEHGVIERRDLLDGDLPARWAMYSRGNDTICLCDQSSPL